VKRNESSRGKAKARSAMSETQEKTMKRRKDHDVLAKSHVTDKKKPKRGWGPFKGTYDFHLRVKGENGEAFRKAEKLEGLELCSSP